MNQTNDGNLDSNFKEREFEEVEGGYYDGNGCYVTPDGSFWDENGIYFDHMGLDRHGGCYDEFGLYNPGQGWNEELGCYNDEIQDFQNSQMISSMINENFKEKLIEDFEIYKQYFDELDETNVVKDSHNIELQKSCQGYLDKYSYLDPDRNQRKFKNLSSEKIDGLNQSESIQSNHKSNFITK